MKAVNNPVNNKFPWLQLLAGLLLAGSFFLPWVRWETVPVKGYSLPSGEFFRVSDTRFGLANPFPQFKAGFLVFWLIPVLAAWAVWRAATGKKMAPWSFIAGTLSLALVTVFILFTGVLIDLGVGKTVTGMLTPWIWLHVFSAILLVTITTINANAWLKKTSWILLGPVFAFAGFTVVKNYLETETFKSTSKLKADYVVTAKELIDEFEKDNPGVNSRYTGKILQVNGRITELEKADSIMNVKMEDMATGSYIIFAFEEKEQDRLAKLQPGDSISVKGEYSTGVYSRLRKTTFINFKRSVLYQQ